MNFEERAELALKEYLRLNEIRNDRDAYLFYLCQWAIDPEAWKDISLNTDPPHPDDFGVEGYGEGNNG